MPVLNAQRNGGHPGPGNPQAKESKKDQYRVLQEK